MTSYADSVFVQGDFRKATASAMGNCIEVATIPTHRLVGVRDSKNPAGNVLAFPTEAWSEFTTALKEDGLY